MDLKANIRTLLNQALTDLNLSPPHYTIEHPANEIHGDYASNVALVLFPSQKKYPSPKQLAKAIVSKIKPDNSLKAISVAGSGFINFTLTNEHLIASAQTIILNQWDRPLQGQKIAVEYTDPNPFKEFHLGHLYSNIIGESISRIFEANGALVWRADFYGDCGLHIAKSVWGLIQKMNQENLTLSDLNQLPLKSRQKILGQGYAAGTIQYDKDPKVKAEILEINSLIYHASENQTHPVIEVYRTGLKWSLAYFETYYQRLGTKFDGYYPESKVGKIGLKLVEQGIKAKILEVGDGGAIVYKGEKDGLHTRVFRNRFGLPTYEAKDLGLLLAKYQDFKFDHSLNIFGKEIDEYFKVVKVVMEKIIPDLGKKQSHLAHGMVNLPEGKMSSRSGNVITVEWLLNQARDLAFKLIHNEKLTLTEKTQVAEMVGQAAVKYALLMSNIGDNVTFNFKSSVTFTGNSGPYLQYTHARCDSVITKSGKTLNDLKLSTPDTYPIDPVEASLIRWFYRYPEVLKEAATSLAPHLICTYLNELAQRYNTFYDKHSILSGNSIAFRLYITAVTVHILKHGLSLLGISAPVKM